MADDWEAISAYTDGDAIEDGVLIALAGLDPVNRVTRAVFAHFVRGAAFKRMPVVEIPKALEPLMAAIRAMLSIPPDRDGIPDDLSNAPTFA